MVDALLKGITLGLLLAISVGPIVFTVIKQSMVNGHKGGFAFIAGISLSDILLVVFSNLFTGLFDLLNTHKKTLSIIASVFLIIIGIYYLFFKKVRMADVDTGNIIMARGDYIKLFVTGFIMNLFNPGIIIFWLTTATTFSSDNVNHRIIIFTIALLIALMADIVKVMLANRIRKNMTSKNIHRVNMINGIILVGFGVFIIFLG